MTRAPDVARVVICEDSPTYAEGLRRLLETDDDLRVVQVCQSAEELLRALPRARADVVTMDIELPGIDGVAAVERIMRSGPVPIMVLSAHTGRGSQRGAAALAAGALDIMPKSEVRVTEPDAPATAALRRRVKRLARTRLSRQPRPDGMARPAAPPDLSGRSIAVIGVCASTGGPEALKQVLGQLPGDFPLPLLIVQHMAAGFTGGLVSWLDQAVAIPVREGREGEPLGRGAIFAPDGTHLVVDRARRLALDRVTEAGWHQPSGDVLLSSLASVYGSRAAAVVLTGLGRDGAEGLGEVAAAGGVTIAQDESSSVVYGMPRAAAERGAELIVDLAGVGAALRSLAVSEALR